MIKTPKAISSETQRRKWSRLDNAAKIFPSTSEKTDTRVFRYSCEFYEQVSPEALQKAVNKAIKVFPDYTCIMKTGLFWYYLEQSELKPIVVPEEKPPCSVIYDGSNDHLLFEVSYYKNRLNLEMYHVLSDGTGAMQFLKSIVSNYLVEMHPNVFKDDPPEFDEGQSVSNKSSDAFRKYYQKQKRVKKEKSKNAFHIKGFKVEDEILNFTEVIMSAKEVVNAAHEYNTTMTVFLTAVYMDSIHKEMSLADEKRPLVIMVPVNLRNFFPSDTARNFFGMISVKYDFSERSGEFSDMLEQIDKQFKEQLTKEKLSIRMNKLAALEHNIAAQIAPLPLKNFVLRIGRSVSERYETAVISNVGKVLMPAEFEPYIKLFSVYASTKKLQLCLCSYLDNLSLCFSSAFVSTAVQQNLVRFLTNMGISAEVRCNKYSNEHDETDVKEKIKELAKSPKAADGGGK